MRGKHEGSGRERESGESEGGMEPESFDMTILPESYLKCMSEEDRKKLGKGGRTWEESLARGEARSEKELQDWIGNLLRLKGIEAIRSRMDRKTSNNVGCPDFLFCIRSAEPEKLAGFEGELITVWVDRCCAWEVKLPGKKLGEEQERMQKRMTRLPNVWRWSLITSVDDALRELRGMGIG